MLKHLGDNTALFEQCKKQLLSRKRAKNIWKHYKNLAGNIIYARQIKLENGNNLNPTILQESEAQNSVFFCVKVWFIFRKSKNEKSGFNFFPKTKMIMHI